MYISNDILFQQLFDFAQNRECINVHLLTSSVDVMGISEQLIDELLKCGADPCGTHRGNYNDLHDPPYISWNVTMRLAFVVLLDINRIDCQRNWNRL